MKKKNSLLFILLMYSLTMLAQKDITKFMGIPVDGFKKADSPQTHLIFLVY